MLEASIQVSPPLTEALRGLRPEVMFGAISRGMKRGAEILAGLVTEERLTGKGPFPVTDHRLGVVTGRLRQSLRVGDARVVGNTVAISIGSSVEYAAAHEFGFQGDVTVKEHKRLGHTVREHQRRVTIPERAPVRTGIKEHLDTVELEIMDEIKEVMRRG